MTTSPWDQFVAAAATVMDDNPSRTRSDYPVAAGEALDSRSLAPEVILSLVAQANQAVIDGTRKEDRPVVPHVHQLGATIAYFHGYRVLEMLTGEGKTIVTLLIATVLVLCKEKVHIATSNTLLSERDCAFMKRTLLSVGSPLVVTTSDAMKSKQTSPTGDGNMNFLLEAEPGTVVFGTIHDLMAFSLHGNVKVLQELTLGASSVVDGAAQNHPQRKWCLLVDEIDFLLCSAMNKVTQLCVMTFGTDELLCLTAGLAVTAVELQRKGYGQTLQVLRRALVVACEDQIHKALCVYKTLSPRQATMLKYTLPSRVDSAIEVMRSMGEDVDFVLDPDRGIVAVSQETGLLEDSVVFGLGRDQILSVLHKQFLYCENVVSRTLSVPTQLATFYKSVGGWSGTLGNDGNCTFLTRIIERTTTTPTRWLRVPPSSTPDKRNMLSAHFTDGRTEHFKRISHLLRERLSLGVSEDLVRPDGVRCGAALVLFATIELAESFHKTLIENSGTVSRDDDGDWGASVRLITQNGKHTIPTEELPLGTIIITTMLMHRGEDLKLSDAVITAGGLLEIDTFIGDSDRTDAQKWGRVARHGQPGTVVQVIDRSACPFAGGFVQSRESIMELRDFGETLAQICNDGANMVNLSQVDLWNLKAQTAIKEYISSPALAQEALDLWGYQMELFRSFNTRLYYEQIMCKPLNDAATRLNLAIDLPISYPSQAITVGALIDRICRFPRNATFHAITKAHIALNSEPSVEVDDVFWYQCSCVVGRPIVVFTFSDTHQRDRWAFDDLNEEELINCARERSPSLEGLENGFNARLYYCECCRISDVEAAMRSHMPDEGEAATPNNLTDTPETPVEVELRPLYIFRLRSGEEMFHNGETVELHTFEASAAADTPQRTAPASTVPLMSCVLSMLYKEAHACDFSCREVPTHVPATYGSLKPTCEEAEAVLCDVIVRRMACTVDACGRHCIRNQLNQRHAADRAEGRTAAAEPTQAYFAKLGKCLADWNRATSFVDYFARCADHFITSLRTTDVTGRGDVDGGAAAASSFLAPSPTQLLYYRASAEQESFEALHERSKKQFTCHLPQLQLVMLRHLGSLKKAELNARVVECLKAFLKTSHEMAKKWGYCQFVTQLPVGRTQDSDVSTLFQDDELNPLEQQLFWIDVCCDALRQNAEVDLQEMTGTEKVKTKCASSAACDVLVGIIPAKVSDTVGVEIAQRIGCWSTRVACRKCRDWSGTMMFGGLASARLLVGYALYCTCVGGPVGAYLVRSSLDDLISAFSGRGFELRDYAESEVYKIALSTVTMGAKVASTCVMKGTISGEAAKKVAKQLLKPGEAGFLETLVRAVVNATASKFVDGCCWTAETIVHWLLEDYNLTEKILGIAGDIYKPGMEKRRETVLKLQLLHRANNFRERLVDSLPQTFVSRTDASAGKVFDWAASRVCRDDESKGTRGKRDRKGFLAAVASGLRIVGDTREENCGVSKAEVAAKATIALASIFDLCVSDVRSATLRTLDDVTRELQKEGWMTDDDANPATDTTNDFVFNSLLWTPAGQAVDAATSVAVHVVRKVLISEGYLEEGLTRCGRLIKPDTDVFALRSSISKCLRPHLPDRATTDRAVHKAVLLLKKIQDADCVASCKMLLQPLYNSILTELDAYTLGEIKSAVSNEVSQYVEKKWVKPLLGTEPAQDKKVAPEGGDHPTKQLPGRDGTKADGQERVETAAAYALGKAWATVTTDAFWAIMMAGDVGTLSNVLYPLQLLAMLDTYTSAGNSQPRNRAAEDLQALFGTHVNQRLFPENVVKSLSFIERCMSVGERDYGYHEEANDESLRQECRDDVVERTQDDNLSEPELQRLVEEEFTRRRTHAEELPDDTPPRVVPGNAGDVPENAGDDSTPPAGNDDAHRPNGAPSAGLLERGLETCANTIDAINAYDDKGAAIIEQYTGVYVRPSEILEISVTVVGGVGIVAQGFRMGGKYLTRRFVFRAVTTYAKKAAVKKVKDVAHEFVVEKLVGQEFGVEKLVGQEFLESKNYKNFSRTVDGVQKLVGVATKVMELKDNFGTVHDQLTKPKPDYRRVDAKEADGVKGLKRDGTLDKRYTKNKPDVDAIFENHVYSQALDLDTAQARSVLSRNASSPQENSATTQQTRTTTADAAFHEATDTNRRSGDHLGGSGDTGGARTRENGPTVAPGQRGGRDNRTYNAAYSAGTVGGTRSQYPTAGAERRTTMQTSSGDVGSGATQVFARSVPGVATHTETAAGPPSRPQRKISHDTTVTTSPAWQMHVDGLSPYYVACVLLNQWSAYTSQPPRALDVTSLRSLRQRLALHEPADIVEVLLAIDAQHPPQVLTYGSQGSQGMGVDWEARRTPTDPVRHPTPDLIFVQPSHTDTAQVDARLPGTVNDGTHSYTFIAGAERASVEGDEAQAQGYVLTHDCALSVLGLYKRTDAV